MKYHPGVGLRRELFYPILNDVIEKTFGVWLPGETSQRLAFVPTIVTLLMVIALSMLRRRWYGRATREQTERTDQHGVGGGLDHAV